jgi:hypothetical protein
MGLAAAALTLLLGPWAAAYLVFPVFVAISVLIGPE